MKPTSVRALLATAFLLVLAPAALAAVELRDWHESSFRDVVDEAARARRPVVLIVTQPDWCPPCIKLDKRWLKNPADTEVRDMTEDAIVLEVHGYEAAGREILERERILFQGTPTVHVFAAPIETRPLGQATLLGSIVGAPDDFPARLKGLLSTLQDPIPVLQRAVDDAPDAVARAKAMIDLGRALAERGERSRSYTAYQAVLRTGGVRLKDQKQQAELAELRRKAAWEQASIVMLRVRKDYRRALPLIDSWRATYVVRPEEQADFSFARAWALQNLGRRDEAIAELRQGLPATGDGADSLLYFCFRSNDRHLWIMGEREAKTALYLYPDSQAVIWQDLGRLQRRMGALQLAERSFQHAVDLSPPGEDREVYESQLETVRDEMAARETGM